jgi:hypothetical protein
VGVEDAARTARVARAPALAFARLEAGAGVALAGIVAASFLLRTAAGWLRATPVYFPDEYIYAELGRSIAESGRPLVRGVTASFPALLQPIITAPAGLFEDVEVSYRLVQATGALLMSLAAVPVFFLARRLGLGTGLALGLAAVAVAVPDLFYASWLIAEPVAYPLAVSAIAAGTLALARPSRKRQLGFVLFAGLATFARVQFVVLPVCFVAALVVVGLRERRLRAAVREQLLPLALFLIPLIGLLAAGPGRALGYYEGILDFDLSVLSVTRWLGSDLMLLAYVSGWVLVPGALLGLVLTFWRPRSREELSFAAFASFFSVAVLLEAAVYAASGANRVQERYFFYVVPLVAIAFGLYARRGWPHRLAFALLAATLVALSARVPLAGYSAADGKTTSPVLLAVAELERSLRDPGLASLIVALLVAALSAFAVAAVFLARRKAAVLVALTLAACGAASVGVILFDRGNTSRVREDLFRNGNASWADAAGLDNIAFLSSPGGERGFTHEQLFWNRSVDDLYLLPGAVPPDAFAAPGISVAGDGSLLVDGDPLVRPLLVDGYGTTIVLRGGSTVAASPPYRLVRPDGKPRLALYMPGRYFDGWLSLAGSVTVWPDRPGEALAGRLELELRSPRKADPVAIAFERPGGGTVSFPLRAGERRRVSLPVCSRTGPWKVEFSVPFTGTVGHRLVSVQTTKPQYVAAASAC